MMLLGLTLAVVSNVGTPPSVPAVVRRLDGAEFVLPEGRLRLQVLSPEVVRVVQAPLTGFSTRPSLARVGRWPGARWSLRQGPEGWRLSTQKLNVSVSSDGTLAFRDAYGGLLLREPGPGARRLRPKSIAGESAYECVQVFIPNKDESFFGLGTHPEGWFDLAGHVVPLIQENTRDSTPFLVSSRGYGLLFDHTSQGEVRLGPSAQPIPASCLRNTAGETGSLLAEYFLGTDLGQPVLSRSEAAPSFATPPKPAPDFPATNFSVRWSGSLVPPKSGVYRIRTIADDGVRLWVAGKLVIDNWTTQAPTERTASVRLEAGRPVPIRLEYFQAGGGAELRLQWVPPGQPSRHEWWFDFADQLDYVFFYGPSMDAIVARYRRDTGQAPLFPVWAYGLWQCKERYKSSEELLAVASEYRRRRLPLDAIIQDWFYWDPHPWGSHQFDTARYPDIAATLRELRDRYHLHTMVSVWAKFAPGSAHYDELDRAGLLYPRYGDWSGSEMRYYDAFSPEGRRRYWRQIRDSLFAKGFEAWWLDATEPEVDWNRFRETKTALGVGARVANAYSLMTTEGVSKGQLATAPNHRVFIMTRSIFAGQQRNAAASWSGDIRGDWVTFRRQIAAGLNNCMAGLPYWNTDIGGFFSRPASDPDYRELFVRWFQYGAFTPIFRIHGTGAAKEPWLFGPEAERILARFIRLRYRLFPYVYSWAWRITADGGTLMRGLPMDFPEDPASRTVDDQFLFGQGLMVCPVTEPGATSRRVWLPSGRDWFDFWTGRRLQGGRWIDAEAPIGRMPLFAPAGTILPLGPELQYSTEKPWNPIELRIYPGRNARFRLYADDGVSNGYLRGHRATVDLKWNDRTRTLEIGRWVGYQGRFLIPLPTTIRVVVVAPGRGAGVEEGRPSAAVLYRGKPIRLRVP